MCSNLWQVVTNLEFEIGFPIDFKTGKHNILLRLYFFHAYFFKPLVCDTLTLYHTVTLRHTVTLTLSRTVTY